jgi:hypothetical protein
MRATFRPLERSARIPRSVRPTLQPLNPQAIRPIPHSTPKWLRFSASIRRF